MSIYGNFKYLIEGKFIDQPESWCIAYIGRRYGFPIWDDDCILGSYLEESLTNDELPTDINGYRGDFYDHLDLAKCCKALKERIEKDGDGSEYDVGYSDMLFSLLDLKEQGLRVDVFYRNEFYECIGSYGCNTTKEDLESGKVKIWEKYD